MPLTDTFIKNTKHSGNLAGDKYADGGGLNLLVSNTGKYWRYSYRFAGKQKTLALGVYPVISLAKARDRHKIARAKLADGVDPSQAKKDERVTNLSVASNTFEVVAREWLLKVSSQRKSSTNNKVKTWLEKDIFPHIGGLPISKITPLNVLSALRKMEARGALDSVHRVKQICGQVFRYGVASGSTDRDVTQDLKDALEKHAPKNFSAITEPKLFGGLLRSIYGYQGDYRTIAALKLSPLLFVRPGELRHAEWSEFDLEAGEWRIPESRMKMGIDHLVPLSKQAVELLTNLNAVNGHGRYLFPGFRSAHRPISENTVNAALRAMGYGKEVHTAHGFRATARTIMDEVLGERVDLIEHQLSHAVKDANGRAYNRTSHMPARTEMMQRWADYLENLRVGGNITHLKTA
ncbi:integrase arm-type DNA-binding domain-containing protein [Polynucleobacter paneuropaeus]|nr:integrase arm-type DNA-binding domain-containing protein [Polynucleobacter paneuropaeus]MBT8577340.1 integrase arm-type DNA-binding domain-containing protein [Polynucleobacter paneuropaeus]